SYFGPLLVAGVKIYEYGPRMLHTKALLVDDSTVLVGSANFDHRSFRLNFEVSVLFEDAAIGAALAQLIEGELASAPRVRQGRRPRPAAGGGRDRTSPARARPLCPDGGTLPRHVRSHSGAGRRASAATEGRLPPSRLRCLRMPWLFLLLAVAALAIAFMDSSMA